MCLGALFVAPVARAQSGSDGGGLMDILVPKVKPNTLAAIKPQPQAWPRLDPGAIFCTSEADLSKLAARRSGQAVDGPVDCQIIRSATAISIVNRAGPGRSEVKISDPKAGDLTGWTDAWLPDKAPVGGKAGRR